MITEKKRLDATILWLKNIASILIVAALVFVLIFLIQGFRLGKNGEVKQTGLVQFASNIPASTVEINGKELSEKTNTKELLLPGEYHFKISKEGYETWENSSKVKAGGVLWLNYARLIPKKKTVENFLNFENLKTAKFSAGRERAFVVSQNSEGAAIFSVIELGDSPKVKEIAVPKEIFARENVENPLKNVAENLKIETIANNASRVLVRWNHDSKTEFISINTLNPEKSVNLTRKFGANFSKILPVNRAQTKFLALSDDILREINIENDKISEKFASKIVDFEPFDENFAVISQKNAENDFSVSVIEKGKKITAIETKIASAPKIEIGRYHNENFIHIVAGGKVKIFNGLEWTGANKPKKIRETAIDFAPEKIWLNPEMRILTVASENKSAIFDLETDQNYTLATNSKLNWLDNFIFYGFENGQLFAQDFDGRNKKSIFAADSIFEVSLSGDNKFIYGFLKLEDGTFKLSRVKMIL